MSRARVVGRGTLAVAMAIATSSVFLAGCDSPRRVDLGTPAPATLILTGPRGYSAAVDAVQAADAGVQRLPTTAPKTARGKDKPETLVVPSADDPAGTVLDRFIVDTLIDVAAAGPAAATAKGVVMINRRNELYRAHLSRPAHSAAPLATSLSPLPDRAGPFPLARAPAVRGGFAYWVSRGRLLRQSIRRSGVANPQVLTEDARVGTRVAVPQGVVSWEKRLPDVAAYIARSPTEGGPLAAKLWRGTKAKPLPLTAEAASATSVSLLATARGMAALSLEGRTGMSTLHMRSVSRGTGAAVAFELGPDRVIWVGGASGSLSEFVPLSIESGTVEGLLATSRDMTHFGLLDLTISQADSVDPHLAPTHWMNYLNGIEPAPVASIQLCGHRMLLIAQPSEHRAHAPQRLLWIEHGAAKPSDGVVLARARSFFDVSVAATPFGALVVYVADQRTWARSIRCSR